MDSRREVRGIRKSNFYALNDCFKKSHRMAKMTSFVIPLTRSQAAGEKKSSNIFNFS